MPALVVDDVVTACPVVPVVVLADAAAAVPLARALLRGGVTVVEVTLRTPDAAAGIAAIRRSVPEVVVGAGTVTSLELLDQAVEAGAQFLVTPGTTERLLDAATASGLPLLPGVATVSEMLRLRERGVHVMKLFPAEAVGGVDLLRSVGGPLGDLRFCPTGGVTEASAPGYLDLPNVACVGGSWLTPHSAVEQGDWDAVEELARRSTVLREAIPARR